MKSLFKNKGFALGVTLGFLSLIISFLSFILSKFFAYSSTGVIWNVVKHSNFELSFGVIFLIIWAFVSSGLLMLPGILSWILSALVYTTFFRNQIFNYSMPSIYYTIIDIISMFLVPFFYGLISGIFYNKIKAKNQKKQFITWVIIVYLLINYIFLVFLIALMASGFPQG